MADLGSQGGLAGAHEAQPITDGLPEEVGTVPGPKGDIVFGFKPAGVGCTRKGAH